MKVVFTKGELENFKKGWGCASFNCSDFSCNRCPIERYLEGGTPEDVIKFIEEHLEKGE